MLANHTLVQGDFVPENGSSPFGATLDSNSGEMFVSSGGGTIEAINTSSNQIVSVIPTPGYVWNVAYYQPDDTLYATHGSFSDTVSVINASTGRILDSIGVGSSPAGVTADPSRGLVYVADSRSANVSVIDASTNRVVRSFSAGTDPIFVALDPVNGDLFVSDFGGITVVNGTTYQVTRFTPTGPDAGLAAFDPANGNFYVPNGAASNISVLNGLTGVEVGSFVIGSPNASNPASCPWGAAYDGDSQTIYVTFDYCEAAPVVGYIAVINTSSETAVTTFPVGQAPSFTYFDPLNGALYEMNEFSLNISVINGTTDRVTGYIGAGDLPADVLYDPDNGLAYVAESGDNEVAVVNGSTGEEVGMIPTGYGPDGLAYDSQTKDLFVANSLSNNLSVVDTRTGRVTAWVPVGVYPQGLAYVNTTGDLYVANCYSDNVTILNATTYRIVGSVGGGNCPSQIAFDSQDNLVYVTNQGPLRDGTTGVDQNVTVISSSSNLPVGSVTAGGGPVGIAYDSANGRIYVANWVSQNVTVISDLRSVGSIQLENVSKRDVSWTWAVAYDPVDNILFASYAFSGVIVAIEPANDTILGNMTVGETTQSLTVDDANGFLLVANWLPGTISLVAPALFPPPRYAVTFEAGGLPKGLGWSVETNDSIRGSVNSSIVFEEPNGVYPYLVTSPSGWAASRTSGNATVLNSNVTIVIPFAETFSISFVDSGLPNGTLWWVNLTNGDSSRSVSEMLAIPELNGTYPFSVGTSDRNYSAANGSVIVDGEIPRVLVVFLRVPFTLEFGEVGLPDGTVWSVTLDGIPLRGVGPLEFGGVVNGTQRFTVGSVPGFVATPANGTIDAWIGNDREQIQFTPGPLPRTTTPQRVAGFPIDEVYLLVLGLALAIAGIVYAARRLGGRRLEPGPATGDQHHQYGIDGGDPSEPQSPDTRS